MVNAADKPVKKSGNTTPAYTKPSAIQKSVKKEIAPKQGKTTASPSKKASQKPAPWPFPTGERP